MTVTTKLLQILQKYFNYDNFRPGQLDIILPLVQGRDLLAILPTGGGKSLCFQIPGLYLGGTTLVISPLISLMQDQVANLLKNGIRATYINSSLTTDEIKVRLQKFQAGVYQFVYLAPEKLAQTQFMSLCQKVDIRLIAVDEAHCISVWGHDFRPEYLLIKKFVNQVFDKNKRPRLACFTATANLQAQRDIVLYSGLQRPLKIQKSFARDNLKILVHQCFNEHDKRIRLLTLLRKHQGQMGIIYVLTRKEAQNLAFFLNRLQICQPEVAFYHGGLPASERASIQTDFIAEKIKVIVATNAFGMGVDQPHIRFVIHAQMSSNLENYWQEIGRGGRDGQSAYCYALYTKQDLIISQNFITQSQTLTPLRKKILQGKLKQVQRYLRSCVCRQKFVLHYFDEKTFEHCGLCDYCRHYRWQFNPEYKNKLIYYQKKRLALARQRKLIPSSIITDLSLSYLVVLDWRRLPSLDVIPGIGTGFIKDYQELLLSA